MSYGVNLHGPFAPVFYLVEYDGFLVPNLLARKATDHPDRWCLVLDERFATEWLPREEIERWIGMIANAQALGAGYPCHGAEKKSNPFRVGIGRIKSTDDPTPRERLRLVPAGDDER